MADNPGYQMGANGFIRRRSAPDARGYYQPLERTVAGGQALTWWVDYDF